MQRSYQMPILVPNKSWKQSKPCLHVSHTMPGKYWTAYRRGFGRGKPIFDCLCWGKSYIHRTCLPLNGYLLYELLSSGTSFLHQIEYSIVGSLESRCATYILSGAILECLTIEWEETYLNQHLEAFPVYWVWKRPAYMEGGIDMLHTRFITVCSFVWPYSCLRRCSARKVSESPINRH